MDIYVEYVIIDNMTIDILILLLTKYFLKLKTSKTKIFLSALLGTIVAVISPILPNIINIAIKIPLATAMILIAYCIKTSKQFFATILTFFASTFVLIGACFGVCELLGIEYLKTNGITYQYDFPIGLILLICSLTFISLKNILKVMFQKHGEDHLEHQVTLQTKEKKIEVTAFLDTGNKLEKDGKPISIINYNIFSKLYPKISITDILLKKTIPLPNAEYFEVTSLGKNFQKILIFEIEALILKNKKIEWALIGLSLENFESGTHCDMIISNKLLGDEYESSNI